MTDTKDASEEIEFRIATRVVSDTVYELGADGKWRYEVIVDERPHD